MSFLPREHTILLAFPNPEVSRLLAQVLRSAGFQIVTAESVDQANQMLAQQVPSLAIMHHNIDNRAGLDTASQWAEDHPDLPIILFFEYETVESLKAALRAGVSGTISLPVKNDELLKLIDRALRQSRQVGKWLKHETVRATGFLQQRIDELEALTRVGQAITRSLDLDTSLRAVVDAAVELTRAEEGSLLLVDEVTGELYMHASRNFNEDFVRTFRLSIQDTLAGSVVRTGKPLVLDQSTPQKIKTTYLVNNLIYVPLFRQSEVIGVLGVDNRMSPAAFNTRDVNILTALADYAVIAIENARLYDQTSSERAKLESILARIEDGVIVFNNEQRLMLINETAQYALQIEDDHLVGSLAAELITQPDLLALIQSGGSGYSNRCEFQSQDGRIFNAQLTAIPDIGLALTLHDLTNLKKLDRIKNDFVSTVSHDLRSPLTAILGYVELIERAGPTTEMQRDFIRRVQLNVHNITSLVDDLVSLGRIEAGFDLRREAISLEQLVRHSCESLHRSVEDRRIQLSLDLAHNLPSYYGNPLQIRQMVDHLLDNALKYTPQGGCISVQVTQEDQQAILQVSDSGMGISPVDLPYIFDKFYRGSNASAETTGTGLGLSIVRSIVENHKGRIWVDTSPDKGSTFTVVLPLAQ